jgi:hypothetical protein
MHLIGINKTTIATRVYSAERTVPIIENTAHLQKCRKKRRVRYANLGFMCENIN